MVDPYRLPPEEELFGQVDVGGVPTVENPFPPSFNLPDESALFPDDKKEVPETLLGKVGRNLTPWAIANNLVVEPIAFTGNALGGIPDAYNELRAAPNKPSMLASAIGSIPQSMLNSGVRNEPEENKNAAKARLLSSVAGGAGGTGAGTAIGALPIFSVPTFGASVPIGAYLGGVAGSVFGDRYGREKLQSEINPQTGKPFLAQGNQSQENTDDAAAAITGLLYGKGANYVKGKTAKGAGGRIVSDNILLENIERGTKPASLQAQALASTGKDYIVRPPRTGTPERLEITPNANNPIDVTATNALQNPTDVIRQLTAEYEQLLNLDTEDAKLITNAGENLPAVVDNSPAVISELDSLFDPEALPTTGNQPNIVGDTTSATVDVPQTLPRRGQRTPGNYYLDQALDEPSMQREMSYRRTGEGSEFDTLSRHSVDRQVAAKNRNVQILSSIPEDQWPTAGDVLFRGFNERMNAAEVPAFRKRPVYDVLYDEMAQMPRLLGWPDADQRSKQYKSLLARQRLSERGGARNIQDGQELRGLTPEEQQVFNGYLQEIFSARLSPVVMDQLKTHFDTGANFQKKHASTIDPKTNRSDAYEMIGNNLRNSLESLVYQTMPDEFGNYRQNNRQMQILNTVEDLANQRGAEENLTGRLRKQDEFKRTPNGVVGLIGDAANSLKRYFVPEPQSREAKLRAADRSNFNRGTGRGDVSLAGLTKGLGLLDRKINQGIEGYQKATTSQFTNNDPLRPPQIGIEGMQAGTIAANNNPENNVVEDVKDETIGFGERLGGAINSLGKRLFGATEAGAQELTLPKLPRKTELMNSESMAVFLQESTKSPETAAIAQGLVKKMVEASNVGDMDKVERIHADMTKLFPQLFESGFGVNGKAFHPDDQAKIMDNLKKLHREGMVDNIFLAKQRNAFADAMDGRILPTPEPFVGAKQPPSQYDKTISTFINEDNNKFSPEDTMSIMHWLTLGHQNPDAQPPPMPTRNPANRTRLTDGTRRYSY